MFSSPPAVFVTFKRGRVHERSLALNVLNGTLFGEVVRGSAGEVFTTTPSREGSKLIEVDLRLRTRMPQAFRLLGFFDEFRDMKEAFEGMHPR